MSGIVRPRAILFDWDDTLADNWDSIAAAMNATLEAFGRPPWTIERSREEARRALRNSFPDLFGPEWEKARDIFYREFGASHLMHLKPRPGAAETLARLAKGEFVLGVVSNKTGKFLREETAHLGWTPYFTAIVGATDAPRDKPDPAPVDLALKEAGIPRGPAVWYVGDQAVDMELAGRAAVTGVLLRERPPKPGEFAAHPPVHHVPSFAALESLIFGA